MKKLYSVFLLFMFVAFSAVAQPAATLGDDEPAANKPQREVPNYQLTLAVAQKQGRVTLTTSKAKQERRRASSTTATSTAYGFGLNGYESFSVSNGVSVTTVAPVSRAIIAGARAGNTLYAVEYTTDSKGLIHSSALLKYDTKKYTFSGVAPMDGDGPIIVDMAYSNATGKMYALGSDRSSGAESLYTIDLATGAVSKMGEAFNTHYYALAANRSGLLYAVAQNSQQNVQLVSINPENGCISQVGTANYISHKASYISSMAMDWSTNTIYWPLCSSDGYSWLVKIDAATGKSTLVSRVGTEKDEFFGLDIEYPQPESAAPAAPTNFTLTPDATGAVTASAQWTNPATTLDGQPLTAISKVVVQVNGTTYKELTDATPGKQSQLDLTGLATGYARVAVVAYSGDLAGEPAEAMKWVGNDVPRAVTGITLERTSPSIATLQWTAPTASVHGGYLRTSALKYRITRFNSMGDSAVVAKTYRKNTTYIDSTITKLSRYYYKIQSLTNDYGETAQSEEAIAGPGKDIPFVCRFEADSTFSLWTTVDGNNDGRTWSEYTYQSYVYHTPLGVDANDWLITPPVNLKADSTYYVYFQFRSGLGEYYPKHMQVTVGTSSSDLSTHKVVWDYHWASRITEQCRVAVPVSADGEYYIGIHDVSEYNSCTIKLTNFCIITKHTGWVTGKVTDADGRPIEGVQVTIPNSGIVDTTATDGSYKLDFVPTGRYAVEFSKHEWNTRTDSVDFVNDQATTHDAVLTRIPTHSISGKVADINNQAIVNAEVTLKGYDETRTTITDDKGTFGFNDVCDHGYRITIKKAKYKTATDSIDLAADTALTYTAEPKTLEPSDYKLTANDQAVKLTWNQPREIYRHDDGTFASQLGSLAGTAKTVNGAVFTEKAVLKSISWVTTSYQGPHNEMNLWIFDIDANHQPTSKVLFNAMHVQSKGDEVWNTYELPQPVEAPNGFFLGVSYDNGMSSLATDTGTDPEYPFIPLTNYSATDYTTGQWRCIDKSFVKRNHLIRATGDEYGQNVQTFDYRYKVWRFQEDDFLDQDKWTPLTPAEGIKATALTDSITNLAAGDYIYAIAAIYPGNQLSEIQYSDNVTVKPSGITSAQIAADIVVAPNPVSEVLHLNRSCDKIEIYTIDGALAIKAQSTDAVNVSSLSTGVYLLRATVGSRIVIKRVVKN